MTLDEDGVADVVVFLLPSLILLLPTPPLFSDGGIESGAKEEEDGKGRVWSCC